VKKNLEAIIETFNTNIIASNGVSKKFAEKFSNFIEKDYAFLYSSGTMALYDLLLNLDIKKGDDVLIPAYICSSVKYAIIKTGANVVFYDNEEKSWISSYEKIKNSVTKNIKAIIVNHTFGLRYKKDEIVKLKQLNIPLIEDNAHFVSNKKEDIEISNLFTASFYSFHVTKLLTTGEGGAILTNDSDLAKKIEQNKLDEGINDINAALGISQLKNYNKFLSKRLEIADIYLSKIPNVKKLNSIYFRFPILVNNIKKFLCSKKVSYKRGVDMLLKNLPNVTKIYNKTISIPIYPALTKIDETNRILELINEN
jgi:dTDP-4-amino-4,6-dideoxygalactose transaminase